MGPAADAAIDLLQRDWFDAFLRDSGGAVSITSGIDLFDVTAKGWRHFPDWPEATLPLYLASGGLAAATGTRFRLSLAGASFPAHPVNPGRGVPPAAVRMEEARPITLAVMHGAGSASCLHLPLAAQRPVLSTLPLRSLHA